MAQTEPPANQVGNFKGGLNLWGGHATGGDAGYFFLRREGAGSENLRWLITAPRRGTTGMTSWEEDQALMIQHLLGDDNNLQQVRFEFTPQGNLYISKKEYGAKKLVLHVPNLPEWNNGHYTGLGVTGSGTIREFLYKVSHTEGRHVFYGYNTELMRIQGNGNVGIGLTTNAEDRLHINDGILRLAGSDVAANTFGGVPALRLGANSTNYSWIQSTGAPLVLNPIVGANSYVAIGFLPTDPSVNLMGLNPDYKLLVKGNILCNELRVKLTSAWPDYVFEPEYKLKTLREVEDYVNTNKRLPDFPSAAEVEQNGIDSGEMDRLLVKKVEEMMLHLIRQEKLLSEQGREIEELKKQNELLLKTIHE